MSRILVAGDVITRRNIFKGHRRSADANQPATHIKPERGGAGIAAGLLGKLFAGDPKVEIIDGCAGPGHTTFHLWEQLERNGRERKVRVWRIRESLGFGPQSPGPTTGATPRTGKSADVVLLDDRALTFRRDPALWPAFLADGARQKTPTWVICATTAPLLAGRLWYELRDRFARQLALVLSVDDLRGKESMISHGRSWEHAVQDVLRELQGNPGLADLARCRHLFLRFGSEGVLWIDNRTTRPQKTLIFDPARLEGEWSRDLPGDVHGLVSCLPVALAQAAVRDIRDPDFAAAATRALAAQRLLLEEGYGRDADRPVFPLRLLADSLNAAAGSFRINRLPGNILTRDVPWSMVEDQPSGRSMPLFARARQVALNGPGSLSGIPFAEFGKLFTVDRKELESYQGLRALIKDYKEEKRAKKPLCLGVFGPPGAGKSFGIKEIAMGILGPDVPILEFNLSQFPDPGMPVAALHRVRDHVVAGRLPVVFWDEFDSRGLAWLQYLLAPMQDGSFLEGEQVHPLGKCIFVFAGGTAYTMAAFTPDRTNEPERFATFKILKGPDFVSRLKGYLDVLGPNRRLVEDPKRPGELMADPNDRGFPIRRALLLRVMAGVFGDARLEIDPGILNAMLRIGEFKHGARSMETVINLVTCGGNRPLVRSNIPPREQLALHVDHDEFMALVQEDQEFLGLSKDLAPAFHDFYRDLCRRNGWTVKYDVPFDRLPSLIKDDNVSAAMRISRVLSLVGLKVVKAGKEKPGATAEFVDIIEENLEELARAEHDFWVEARRANGWVHGRVRQDENLVHDLLVPFDQLDDDNKQKDRENVIRYPEIVARAGYRIVKES